MRLEFGIRVPNSGPLSSVENIIRAAKEAEEMNFDTVWLHDHVVWSGEMHRHHISSGSTDAITDEQKNAWRALAGAYPGFSPRVR